MAIFKAFLGPTGLVGTKAEDTTLILSSPTLALSATLSSSYLDTKVS